MQRERARKSVKGSGLSLSLIRLKSYMIEFAPLDPRWREIERFSSRKTRFWDDEDDDALNVSPLKFIVALKMREE